MPQEHRDDRYYSDAAKSSLKNQYLAWGWTVALNAWQLDSVRKLRKFDGWNSGGWQVGTSSNKDALNGKEEAVAGGREWLKRCQAIKSGICQQFVNADWLGASTLIKRVWHISYLRDKGITLETDAQNIERKIARSQQAKAGDEGMYYAVIALDGDKMGARISGENAPTWDKVLADYTIQQEQRGAISYFRQHGMEQFLQQKRTITPSYHAQFSEALSNFALQCVPQIIKQADGVLIYAGGDDVLAIVPVDRAIECAKQLREAFRGESSGFEYKGKKLLLPGQGCDVSVGIAIGSMKASLQDLIRQAMQAEKHAKNQLDRGALALTILKRSGEISRWGCKWNSSGLQLVEQLTRHLLDGQLSNRFSSRLCELLKCYVSSPLHTQLGNRQQPVNDLLSSEELQSILAIECATVISRQKSASLGYELQQQLQQAFSSYIGEICKQQANNPALASEVISCLSSLLQSVAFLARKDSSKNDQQP